MQPVGSNGLRVRPVTVTFGTPSTRAPTAGCPPGVPAGEITDEVMDRIAALSPQERVDAYNEPAGGSDEVDANTV